MPFPHRSGASKIQGMVSSEKEGFDLCVRDVTPPEKGASPVEGAVEEWMTLVEQAMKDSLKVISKTGIFNYASSPRSEWILDADVLGMVTLAGMYFRVLRCCGAFTLSIRVLSIRGGAGWFLF